MAEYNFVIFQRWLITTMFKMAQSSVPDLAISSLKYNPEKQMNKRFKYH